MAKLPRTDAAMDELAEAATTLLFVLGPTGRAAIRAHLLVHAEEPFLARCLKVMNDFERIQDWRAKGGSV